MSILTALMQNCKIANAISNSMAVLTENGIAGAALERHAPAKLRRRSLPVQPRIGVLGAIMNTVYASAYSEKVYTVCVYWPIKKSELEGNLNESL